VVTKRTICARYIHVREERERELLLLLQRVRNFFFFCLFLCARACVLSEKGAFYLACFVLYLSNFGEEKARGERFTLLPREKGGSVCSMNRDDDDDDAIKKQRVKMCLLISSRRRERERERFGNWGRCFDRRAAFGSDAADFSLSRSLSNQSRGEIG